MSRRSRFLGIHIYKTATAAVIFAACFVCLSMMPLRFFFCVRWDPFISYTPFPAFNIFVCIYATCMCKKHTCKIKKIKKYGWNEFSFDSIASRSWFWINQIFKFASLQLGFTYWTSLIFVFTSLKLIFVLLVNHTKQTAWPICLSYSQWLAQLFGFLARTPTGK